MGQLKRNFIKGRMNKSVDERLVPQGEYIDAMNVRLGSTEVSEIGAVENSKGNEQISFLAFGGQPLSASARCIGAFEDGANETIYWFVHDPANPVSPINICDMIVSFDTKTTSTTYHVVSSQDSANPTKTVLNFNPTYVITGVNKIDNLLLWTDDYNAPRRINVTSTYPLPTGGVDQITNKMLNVIVQPPVQSPTITLFNQPGQENYMETRFIAFSYRYKYADGEYSALSQFSDIAFEPEDYVVDVNNYLNGGMKNYYNSVRVGFDVGDSLVQAVDVCFKFADDNIVRVIEKYDKSEQGWPDNTSQTIEFSNSKIYTVLTESELLRLYDNVPRYAKAQTLMGNRLMYGNYVDGYNLTDQNGDACNQTFIASLQSDELGLIIEDGTTTSADWTFPGSTVTVPNGLADLDLSTIVTTVGLKKGATISFNIEFSHWSYEGADIPAATAPTSPFGVEFTITLQQDYTSVFDLASSSEFQSVVGVTFPALAVPLCATGNTVTDAFNCAVLEPSGYTKKASGRTTALQPILVGASPTGNYIRFQFPCMQYNVTGVPLDDDAYQVFRISSCSWVYNAFGNKESLHSNRDYEIGIVYMDEYNRATTALVSDFNTFNTPCSTSNNKNRVHVEIPPDMAPPSWSTRYRWVIKPSETTYETIFSNIYYIDPLDQSAWIKLEGENQLKIQIGDILRVKVDSNGALDTCVDAVVLDKVVQPRDFLTDGAPDPIEQEPGTYMRLKPKNFSVEYQANAFFGGTTSSATTKDAASRVPDSSGVDRYCYLQYPVFDDDGATITKWPIVAGAVVNIRIKFYRPNRGCGATNACGALQCIYEISHVSSQAYANLYLFWIGEGLNITNNMDCSVECPDDSSPDSNIFYSTLYDITTSPLSDWYTDEAIQGTNQIQFIEETATGKMYLTMLGGARYCTGIPRKWSTVECQVSVMNADNMLVFETIPIEAQPDIFYFGSESFEIATLPGTNIKYHKGNQVDQNPVTGASGRSLLGFFDCYAFGNGVESYKIYDSLIGHTFGLGQQVTAVAAQDYKEADRYADITYSGVYNNETNVNKLNEFNLGLANFKPCEESFGSIEILSARETDVLTLQEDKISYVLAGKNLLSDAAAGGAITSVPEVLGTQIARVEEYGISHNPESFIQWGENKYFSDAKRGALVQLKGVGKNERLSLISSQGMRSWFRDLFNTSFNTQKLGAYDPYMDEYVFSSNDIQLPIETPCLPCGFQSTYVVPPATPLVLCVELGSAVGDWVLTYEVNENPETFTIDVLYNGVTTTTGVVNPPVSGSLTITKDIVSVSEATITVTTTGNSGTFTLTANCVTELPLTIVPVCITSDGESGQFIHNRWNFTQGTYNSPYGSRAVEFGSGTGDVVSDYILIPSVQGQGNAPPNSATVTIQSANIGSDNFVFNALSDNMAWLRSNTLYTSSAADITALLAAATNLVPTLISTGVYESTFTMPVNSNQYLYLIYDYRNITPIELCYSTIGTADACCTCEVCETCKAFSGTTAAATLAASCALARGTTYYFEGRNTEPIVGDRVYSNSMCTTLLAASAWIGINAVNTDAIYVDATGRVTNKSGCT